MTAPPEPEAGSGTWWCPADSTTPCLLPPKPTSRPALYLHLDALGDAPDLRANADMKRRLPPDAYKVLLAFLKETNRPSLVLFSIPVGWLPTVVFSLVALWLFARARKLTFKQLDISTKGIAQPRSCG